MDDQQPASPGRQQIGITMSFVVQHDDDANAHVDAFMMLEKFHESVQILRQDGFPRLQATVTARTEFLP